VQIKGHHFDQRVWPVHAAMLANVGTTVGISTADAEE
jgi:hypothetical protein